MSITFAPAWIATVVLVWVRLGAMLLMSPAFPGLQGMVLLRVLFGLALSVCLVGGEAAGWTGSLAPLSLALAALAELAVGAVLALGVHAAFAAFALAGKLLDVQIGFGLGTVYDPVTRAGAPVFATLLNLAAVAVFFALDGHQALLRGIAFSLQQVPPGQGLSALDLEAALRLCGLMFSMGVALIIPVMLGLLLVEVGLAVLSRTLPQMNIIFVGVPIKIVAGLLLFGLTAGYLAAPMQKIFAGMFAFWDAVLRHG